MKKAVVDKSKCDKSSFCPVKRLCPVKAVSQNVKGFFGADAPEIDHDICIGCGKCVNYCPMGAVKMVGSGK